MLRTERESSVKFIYICLFYSELGNFGNGGGGTLGICLSVCLIFMFYIRSEYILFAFF